MSKRTILTLIVINAGATASLGVLTAHSLVAGRFLAASIEFAGVIVGAALLALLERRYVAHAVDTFLRKREDEAKKVSQK